MATHSYPGYGYGIRYDYGMFAQNIINGEQIEQPESWLKNGNPWEIERPTILYPIAFGGKLQPIKDDKGHEKNQWIPDEHVMAMAYDMPISGYNTETVLNLRLWSARATKGFDFSHFNQGNYIEAVRNKTLTETLSRVLYPMDNTLTETRASIKTRILFCQCVIAGYCLSLCSG